MNSEEKVEQKMAPPGLEGVVVARTGIGGVRGDEGFYHYRQYSAADLARVRSFEDVWHLMIEGRLPDPAERRSFGEEAARLSPLAPETSDLLRAIGRTSTDADPMSLLRTGVSLLTGTLGYRPWLDEPVDRRREQVIQVGAMLPEVLAVLYRSRAGLPEVRADEDLGYAARYLQQLTGERPDPRAARALEQYLVSTIDHGFNASTFTARTITSTGADLGSAVTGAIGALSGPLHGGAPSRVLDMLDEIERPEQAEPILRAAIAKGERIMGFGHRVYRTEDPRSALLKSVALDLGGPRVELALAVEEMVLRLLREAKPDRELYANVEFYAAVVLEATGLPRELFPPTFAVSRTIGWTAHFLEQTRNNRIIRPKACYDGPPAPAAIPPAEPFAA